MELSQKQKIFPQVLFIITIFSFFLAFSKFDSIFNIFKKKTTLIGDIFLNLRTPKYVVK